MNSSSSDSESDSDSLALSLVSAFAAGLAEVPLSPHVCFTWRPWQAAQSTFAFLEPLLCFVPIFLPFAFPPPSRPDLGDPVCFLAAGMLFVAALAMGSVPDPIRRYARIRPAPQNSADERPHLSSTLPTRMTGRLAAPFRQGGLVCQPRTQSSSGALGQWCGGTKVVFSQQPGRIGRNIFMGTAVSAEASSTTLLPHRIHIPAPKLVTPKPLRKQALVDSGLSKTRGAK
jgi:hypothetical protein